MTYHFAPLKSDAVEFLTEQTGVNYRDMTFDRWLCVTARGDDDQVLGVWTLEPKTWFDWHMSAAIADPRCLTKRLLQAMFRAVFLRCGAVRVTALVDPDNRRALSQMRRLGFVYEGFLRMGVEGTRDGMMFGMLRADCPWLPGYTGGTILPQPTEVAHGLYS